MGVKTRHLVAQKSHLVVTSGKPGRADTTKAPQSQLLVQAMPGLVAVCQAELKGLKSPHFPVLPASALFHVPLLMPPFGAEPSRVHVPPGVPLATCFIVWFGRSNLRCSVGCLSRCRNGSDGERGLGASLLPYLPGSSSKVWSDIIALALP